MLPATYRDVPRPAARARHRALLHFVTRRARTNGWVQAGRWLAALVGVGFAVLMLSLRWGTSAATVDVLVERALSVLTWVGGGLAAFGLARDPAETDTREGITSLLHQRGHQDREIAAARWLARAWVIAASMAPSVLALTALHLALARTVGDLGVGLVLAAATAGYVALASVGLTALVGAAIALDPARPRLAFAGLLVVPELLRAAGLAVPGLPSLLAQALAGAFAWGAA